MSKMPDVDIDVKDRAHALEGHRYVPASLLESGDLRRHNSGVFFQNIPVDPVSGLAVFPSGRKSEDIANQLGFFKLDLIPNHAYKHVRSPEHLDELLNRPVDWDLFLRPDVVQKLQQLGKWAELVDAYEPRSIEDLACLIAIIRPQKMYLIGEEWPVVRREIWKPEKDGSYAYKKSHAVAFAMCIVVQLQSLVEVGEIEV